MFVLIEYRESWLLLAVVMVDADLNALVNADSVHDVSTAYNLNF